MNTYIILTILFSVLVVFYVLIKILNNLTPNKRAFRFKKRSRDEIEFSRREKRYR